MASHLDWFRTLAKRRAAAMLGATIGALGIPAGTTAAGLTQELAANTAFWRPIVQATGYKITN